MPQETNTMTMPEDPTAGILGRLDAAEKGDMPAAEAPPSRPAAIAPESPAPPSPKENGKPSVPTLPKPVQQQARPEAQAPPTEPEGDEDGPVPRSKSDWTTAKQKISAKAEARLKPTIDTLKAEIETLKRAGAPKAEIDALVKERDEYRDLIRKVAIDKDPQFNAEFQAKTAQVEGQLKAYFGDDVAADGMAILKMPPSSDRAKALGKFAKDLNPFQASVLATQLSVWDSAHADRHGKLEAASKNWDAYQAQIRNGSQQQQVRASEQFEQSFQETLREFGDSGHDYFRNTGDQAHDQQVAQRMALARYAVTGDMTPKEVSQMALYATLTPQLVQDTITLRQQLAEANAQVARLKGDHPSAARNMGGKEAEAPKSFTSGESLADHITKAAMSQGLV